MAMKILAYIFFMFLSYSNYAWNSLGHRLVAQIAYDHLNEVTKKKLMLYNQAVDHSFASNSLMWGAVWLDTLHNPGQRYLKEYHYIDLPFTLDMTPTKAPALVNAVTAYTDALNVLKNEKTSLEEKGLSLRIILHVIGDLHQPMHTISQFSASHPQGDKGGNLYELKKNPIATNLHAYWDRGGGLLLTKKKYRVAQLRRRAHTIEKKWPCDTKNSLDPRIWAQESHKIAKEYAYLLKEHHKPTKNYQHLVRRISESQIAIAGCRLARVLNQI